MKISIHLVLVVLLLCCSGCFVVQVERSVGAGEAQYIRKNFYLFGRIGEYAINLDEECPQGTAQFGDRFTFSDVMFGVLTLGIYTPRTVVVRCAVGAGGR